MARTFQITTLINSKPTIISTFKVSFWYLYDFNEKNHGVRKNIHNSFLSRSDLRVSFDALTCCQTKFDYDLSGFKIFNRSDWIFRISFASTNSISY